MRRKRERELAPEFPEDVRWLNVREPLRMEDLRGRVVLLFFWASCCINSQHVFPDLKRLLAAHAPELAVIAVHSPRFTAERDVRTLRNALARHHIDYPVIDDRDMAVWRAWRIRAWPTVVLVAPGGEVLGRRTGERAYHTFSGRIADLIRAADRIGTIDHTPVPLVAEEPTVAPGVLSFPSGIDADEGADRLFISDTGNNRVLIARLDGTVLDVAGSGEEGHKDGPFEEANLNAPLGVVRDAEVLYVADRGNHCIRRVDLMKRSVRTIAGTGEQEAGLMEPGKALSTPLNSPWDLTIIHHRLYITMAGAHQIWRLDLMTDDMEPYAGGGIAGLKNGTRGKCLLAQPAGLTSDDVRLFFVDGGSSSLRWVYLPPSLQTGTWVGKGLYEYGDRDGSGVEALLQHPLGVTHHLGDLYIADTYNHKIKRLNTMSARIDTVLGSGEAGLQDSAPGALNEPVDVTCAAGRLWIADRNNHAIRVAPIGGGPLSTLELRRPGRATAPGRPSAP